MFLKIIHKLEANNLCCYQKGSYKGSVGKSFKSLYLCPKSFNIRDKVWCKVSRLSEAEQSKIPDNIIATVGDQLNNLRTGYKNSYS